MLAQLMKQTNCNFVFITKLAVQVKIIEIDWQFGAKTIEEFPKNIPFFFFIVF